MCNVVHVRERDVIVSTPKDPQLAATHARTHARTHTRTHTHTHTHTESVSEPVSVPVPVPVTFAAEHAYLLAVSSIAGRKSVSVGP
eukprot:COSAG03_NODE_1263_length_4445_cov_70.682467_9_plen_86_part_00